MSITVARAHEGLLTQRTFIWSLATVCSRMPLNFIFAVGSITTLITLVFLPVGFLHGNTGLK